MDKVKVVWEGGHKEFGDGEYSAQNNDFPNDAITEIHVPFGWFVGASKDYSHGGKKIGMEGTNIGGVTVHKASNHGLANAISCLVITSPSLGF